MSNRIKTWTEIKHVVLGVNHNNVGAVLIVEALLLSTSKENFVDLMMVAMGAGDSIDVLCSGDDEE